MATDLSNLCDSFFMCSKSVSAGVAGNRAGNAAISLRGFRTCSRITKSSTLTTCASAQVTAALENSDSSIGRTILC